MGALGSMWMIRELCCEDFRREFWESGKGFYLHGSNGRDCYDLSDSTTYRRRYKRSAMKCVERASAKDQVVMARVSAKLFGELINGMR